MQFALGISTAAGGGSVQWESVVLAVATVVLVGITAYYASQTHRLVNGTNRLVSETRNLVTEAEAARRPLLLGSLDLIAPDLGELRLVNAGGSAATSVAVRFWAVPSGQILSWSRPVMEPGDSVNFRLLPEDTVRLPDFLRRHRAIHIKGTYEDVSGHQYDMDDEVPVATLWAQTRDTYQLAAARRIEDRQLQALQDIAKHLDKLAT